MPGPSSSQTLSFQVDSSIPLQGAGIGVHSLLSDMPIPHSSFAPEVFDPECSKDDESSDDSEDDGAVFRKQAFAKAHNSSCNMVRTRSQTSKPSDVDDLVGQVVFAHKGKSIPCWFPGRVLKKNEKGYEIEFFGNLGTEVCTSRNTIQYEEYFNATDVNKTLFKVPSKLKKQFQDALDSARKVIN